MTLFEWHSLTAASATATGVWGAKLHWNVERPRAGYFQSSERKFEFYADRRFQCSQRHWTPHTIQPFRYQFRERIKRKKSEENEKEMKSKQKYALKCKLNAAIVPANENSIQRLTDRGFSKVFHFILVSLWSLKLPAFVMNSMQSETSLKKSRFVFIAAENRRDCFNVRRRQWLTSFPSLSLSFAVSTSFFETFSYSAFNYLHFPIKFRLSMLHCFAPRRQSLELKFQTRHLFITRHPNRKKRKFESHKNFNSFDCGGRETWRRFESPALFRVKTALHCVS